MSKFTDDLEKNAGVYRIPDPISDLCERIRKEVDGVIDAYEDPNSPNHIEIFLYDGEVTDIDEIEDQVRKILGPDITFEIIEEE